MDVLPNHYEALGLASSASPAQVKAAFRVAMREQHPDVNPDADPEAVRAATAAYEVLSDPDRRARYDTDLRLAQQQQSGARREERPAGPRPHPSQPGPSQPRQDAGAAQSAQPSTPSSPPRRTPPPTSPPADGTWLPVEVDGEATARVQYPGRRLRVFGGGTLALVGLLVAVGAVNGGRAPLLETPGRAAIGVTAVSLIGFLAGWFVAPSPRRPRRGIEDPAQTKAPHPIVVGVIALIFTCAAALVIPDQAGAWEYAAQALVAGMVGGFATGAIWRVQRLLNQVVNPRALADFEVFGRPPAGAEADLLEEELAALHVLPGVRVVRADGHTFTHAVVCGTKVAFVRAVLVAAGGRLRWRGSSLLADTRGGYPLEVVRGPFEEAVQTVQRRLRSQDVETAAWVVVFPASTGTVSPDGQALGLPDLVRGASGVRAIGEWLAEANDVLLVDQQVFVVATGALLEA